MKKHRPRLLLTKNFLDDLDDDDMENDREWSPGFDDKENVKPK